MSAEGMTDKEQGGYVRGLCQTMGSLEDLLHPRQFLNQLVHPFYRE